ncbi:3' exoribonuclease family, domain 1-domain containing protein, partial [Rhodotorula toruloides]
SRTQLLKPSALRSDSRLPLELRSLDFQILPSPPSPATSSSSAAKHPPGKAHGYALASYGLTTVSSSVFGPRRRTGPWSSTGTGQGAGGGVGQAAGGQQKWDRGSSVLRSEGAGRAGLIARTIELAAAVKNTSFGEI